MERIPFLRFFQSFKKKDQDYRASLKAMLGFRPQNLELYHLAFTHRSAAKTGIALQKISNERLEFLGDAVLSAIVAELVFKQFPEKEEGFLTEMRSKMVNRSYLNEIAEKIGILNFLEFDRRVFSKSGPTGSILGDALEALIGAIYLDRGFHFTYSFYKNRVFEPFIDLENLHTSQINYKSKLIEWGQRNGKEILFETVLSATENANRHFEIRVLVSGKEFGYGQDFTKKNAEKMAAEKACGLLKI